MRFLAVTDFHGNYAKAVDILHKAGVVDGTLVAGDLTEFGPAEKAKQLIDMLPRPILAVPGNCDPKEIVRILEREGVCLHRERITFDGITFVGIGGSNPTPFGTPFELSEGEIREALEELIMGVKGPIGSAFARPAQGLPGQDPQWRTRGKRCGRSDGAEVQGHRLRPHPRGPGHFEDGRHHRGKPRRSVRGQRRHRRDR